MEAKSEQQLPEAAGAVLDSATMEERSSDGQKAAPSNTAEVMGLQEGADIAPQTESSSSEGPSCDINSEPF